MSKESEKPRDPKELRFEANGSQMQRQLGIVVSEELAKEKQMLLQEYRIVHSEEKLQWSLSM